MKNINFIMEGMKYSIVEDVNNNRKNTMSVFLIKKVNELDPD